MSRIVNVDTQFDPESFVAYSPAYLSAGNILLYGIFCMYSTLDISVHRAYLAPVAIYTATLTHTALYHRREIAHGFRTLIGRKSVSESYNDIHTKLMKSYKEVPEWVYFSILVISVGLGAVGVGVWPTHTTPAVVLYGVFLAIIFCIPIGIIQVCFYRHQ